MVKQKSTPQKMEVASSTLQQTIDEQLLSGNDNDESHNDNDVTMQGNYEAMNQTQKSKENNKNDTLTDDRKIIFENETPQNVIEKSVKRRKIIYDDDDELIIADMNEFEETLDEVQISNIPNKATILRIKKCKHSGNQESISQKNIPPKHNLMTQISSKLDDMQIRQVNSSHIETEIEPNTVVQITTGDGLKKLLLLFHSTNKCQHENYDESNTWYASVAQALETYEFIQAFLVTGEVPRLEIYITETVWTTFSPAMLATFSTGSFLTSNKERNRLETILALQKMLGELFPNTILSDVVHKIITIPSKEIIDPPELTLNAKTIYSVVDNIHDITKQYENQTIPGLRPELRQYQKAAVDWMLRREGCNHHQLLGNEFHGWELAWVVIDHKNIDSITSHDDRIKFQYCLPLFEWKLKNNFKSDKAILYNPFNGWVVPTYQDAKFFTLNHHKLSTNQSEQDGDSMTPSTNYLNISGGILADSMGLGKTVEVRRHYSILACWDILYIIFSFYHTFTKIYMYR